VICRLAERRRELTVEIGRMDDLMRAVSELQKLLPQQDVPDTEGDFQSPRSAPRERNIIPPAEIAAFARETLLAEGRPMKRGALVKAIETRGLSLTGRDKGKNLGTILWRNAQMFVNLDKRGYWVRGEPLPGPAADKETET
jgi:hypothetical protein